MDQMGAHAVMASMTTWSPLAHLQSRERRQLAIFHWQLTD